MATDDERREVAERLREKSRKYARELSSSHTSINAYHEVREVLYGTDGSPKSLCEFFDRLADLIDPDCEEGRYSVARTVRPVDREAESGHESGQNPDTVQIESPTVQKATACDREALLAQVKELEKCAWYFGLDFDADEPLRDRLKEASEDFAGCARRIREALGVSDD